MISGFDWRLTFQRHSVPKHERDRQTSRIDPIRSPTMAEGLFVVSKKYFQYLGTYNTGKYGEGKTLSCLSGFGSAAANWRSTHVLMWATCSPRGRHMLVPISYRIR